MSSYCNTDKHIQIFTFIISVQVLNSIQFDTSVQFIAHVAARCAAAQQNVAAMALT